MNRIAIIERCGTCWHYDGEIAGFCRAMERPVDAAYSEAPPDWCPLPPAADVARVKPLEWERVAGARAIHEYHECVSVKPRQYAVRTAGPDHAWQYWDVPINCWLRCDDLADGQRKSEAHYRAALFGENGPLVQIVAATTQGAATNEKQAHNHSEKPHRGGIE